MQTFLPFSNFTNSLSVLDDKRLGKQRVEAYQIITTLFNSTKPWRNHPAVLMWKGHEQWLVHYYNTCLRTWESRGFQNIKLQPITIMITQPQPWWLGDERFHSSHRRALLYKDIHWYSQFKEFADDKPELNYWWPTKNI